MSVFAFPEFMKGFSVPHNFSVTSVLSFFLSQKKPCDGLFLFHLREQLLQEKTKITIDGNDPWTHNISEKEVKEREVKS